MGLGLIVSDPSDITNSLMGFDIGFSVTDTSPIEQEYTVRVGVGAHRVLDESINHNLPSSHYLSASQD